MFLAKLKASPMTRILEALHYLSTSDPIEDTARKRAQPLKVWNKLGRTLKTGHSAYVCLNFRQNRNPGLGAFLGMGMARENALLVVHIKRALPLAKTQNRKSTVWTVVELESFLVGNGSARDYVTVQRSEQEAIETVVESIAQKHESESTQNAWITFAQGSDQKPERLMLCACNTNLELFTLCMTPHGTSLLFIKDGGETAQDFSKAIVPATRIRLYRGL